MASGHSLDLSGAVWVKSRRSSAQGNNCVEVAQNLPAVVAVRDSKNPDGPALILNRQRWQALTRQIKNGASSLI